MKTHLFILIFLVIALNSCKEAPSKYVYNQGFVYGTMYHVVYESPNGKDFQDEITEKLNEYNQVFSTYEPTSTISKINNNAPVKLGPLFIECYNRSMEISEITGGAFDITAGPMVNA